MADSECDRVRISPEPIVQDELITFVSDPSAGAVSVFLGTTRNNFKGKVVVQLEYEAYAGMALKQLKEICSDVRAKWRVCKTAVTHRIGVVPVGESSVMIAVSSEHRKEAIEATAFVIEAVKRTATIWKKEVYEEGNSEWKANKECTWTSS